MKTKIVVSGFLFITLLNCQSRNESIKENPFGPNEEPTILNQYQSVKVIPPPKSPCPSDMVEIEGYYCNRKEEICLYNIDSSGNRLHGPGTIDKACGEFKNPTRCLSDKTYMHFCIDRYEFPNKAGEVPRDWMNWFDAKRELESISKRLCTAKEWTFAASGKNQDEPKPLPYGNGYIRDNKKCNIGVQAPNIDRFKSTPTNKYGELLRSYLKPSGSMPECVSDFGVYDMSGNADEIVFNESGSSCLTKTTGNCISGLKGGHWIANVRNASSPMTTIHGEGFAFFETGSRGCRSIQ